ncbi:MAG: hypothetical protein J6O17_06540 [Eubacterium sp.]|nr:hypothetical protein [Eubacterium sp.]
MDNNQNYNQGYPQQGAPQGYVQQGMPQGYPQQNYQQSYSQPMMPPQGNPYTASSPKKIGLLAGIIMVIGVVLVVGVVGLLMKNKGGKGEGSRDYFVNHSWNEIHGSSYLVPEEDGTFKYYKDKGVYDNYYYEGHFDYYKGEAAYKYITEDLSSYGVTKSEINQIISMNSQYTKDNLVCIMLHNEKCWIDGEDTLEGQGTIDTPYYGCYVEGQGLDVANMNAVEYYFFTPESK